MPRHLAEPSVEREAHAGHADRDLHIGVGHIGREQPGDGDPDEGAIAWLFAAYVPNAYVEIAVGLTGVCFALYTWFGKVPMHPHRPSVPMAMFWGSLAGFTSTIIQVGAPPYQIHILPQRLDKLTLIGTTIIFFALVNVMKLVPYIALGQFSTRTLGTSLVLLPFAVASNFLGLWLARRTPTELFYKIAYVLMFLISLGLIWQGIAELPG